MMGKKDSIFLCDKFSWRMTLVDVNAKNVNAIFIQNDLVNYFVSCAKLKILYYRTTANNFGIYDSILFHWQLYYSDFLKIKCMRILFLNEC